MPRLVEPFLRRWLACIVLVAGTVSGGRGIRADEPAVAAVPTPSPTPDPAKAERRKLCERLAALDDAAFAAYLKAHGEETCTPKMVVAMLGYAEKVGFTGDNAGEARLVGRAGQMADLSGDRGSQAHVLWNRAVAEGALHHVDKGLAMLGEALDMATEANAPPRDIAGILGARIISLVRKGDYARAMADCDRALKLSTEANYQDGALAVLCALANIYQRQGQPAQALPYLDQAQKWAAGDRRFLAYVDDNYGVVYKLLGQTEKAREYLGRALASARQLTNPNLLVELLNENGQAALENHDFAAARSLLEENVALAKRIGAERELIETRVHLAELAVGEARYEEAATVARAAYADAGISGEMELEWQSQNLLGQALLASGKKGEAEAAFRTAISLVENIRASAAGDEEASASVLETRVEPYRKLIALLVDEGKAPEAFATAENAKARVLRDILQNGRMDLASALTDDERKRRLDAEERLGTLNRQLQGARNGGKDDAEVAKAQTAVDAARVAVRNLDNTLLSAHPEVRKREAAGEAVTTGEKPTVPGGEGTLFLEYVSSPEATTVFMSGPGASALEARTLPLGAEALRGQVEAFRKALAERSLGWQGGAAALGRQLLAPAAERLGKAKRVVIVPDGPLWDLPFQALRRPDGGECLIDRLAVSYAPSASFLAQVRRRTTEPVSNRKEEPAGGKLLAMGNPALGGDMTTYPAASLMGDAFAPLPAAEDEVKLIGTMYGGGQEDVFLGEQAREEVFKREAPRCDILHLATHGLLNDANPLYSCLLMAQTGLAPGEDGLLEAREIMELHLHARLAVLAACETARGKAGAGEGQLGLSWALMVAGCPASVVSQWKVDSRSNVDLMVELHRQLRAGKPPDEALRAAALALRKKPGYENPFYWAPFVVVGDGG